jgi:hypothetical protein
MMAAVQAFNARKILGNSYRAFNLLLRGQAVGTGLAQGGSETLDGPRCLTFRGDEQRTFGAIQTGGAWSIGFALPDFGPGNWVASRHLRLFEGAGLAAASPVALVLGHRA